VVAGESAHDDAERVASSATTIAAEIDARVA